MKKYTLLFFVILLSNNAICQTKLPTKKTVTAKKVSKARDNTQNEKDFLIFWNTFIKIICVRNIDKKRLQNVSYSYLDCREKILSFDTFYRTKSNNLFDDLLKKVIKKNKDMNFTETGFESGEYEPFIKGKLKSGKYPVIQCTVVKYNYFDGNPKLIILDFITINKQFKLYGYDEIGG